MSDKCGMIAKLQGLDTKDDEAVATACYKKFVDLIVVYHEIALVGFRRFLVNNNKNALVGFTTTQQGKRKSR